MAVCKGLPLENLRQILEEIMHLVYNASSRRSVEISDYISFIRKSDQAEAKFNLDIEEKRITTTKVMQIINKNLNLTVINKKSDSLLELVDIEIVDDKIDSFPKLDVKIRNIGDTIAMLKSAEIHVRKTWTLLSQAQRVAPLTYVTTAIHDAAIGFTTRS